MFAIAQLMSSCECLSITARSELGSDLDCSVINTRSELGSDLDCYELSTEQLEIKYKIFVFECAMEDWKIEF